MNNPVDKSGQDRYKYLIDSILQSRKIWMLQAEDGSFAMFEDNSGQSYVPVWPDKEMTEPFAVDDWEGYIPASMGLGEFLDWMNELKKDGIMIGAFPDSNMQSLSVDPLAFKSQLT
jgi:hypothetical protein